MQATALKTLTHACQPKKTIFSLQKKWHDLNGIRSIRQIKYSP
jgi:hypothetical protein